MRHIYITRMINYKKKFSLTKRLKESTKMLKKYPDRIPIIIDSNNLKLERYKYLVPSNLTVMNFRSIMRKKITVITEKDAIFMFCANYIIMSQEKMGDIYKKYKDKDGFLYITISKENTFGHG